MTSADTDTWVRPYTATCGRTRPSTALALDSQVRATGQVMPERLEPGHAEALRKCRTPTSVAEVAALLRQPVMVTKVLLADLIESGALITRPRTFEAPSPDLLRRLLDGLHRL